MDISQLACPATEPAAQQRGLTMAGCNEDDSIEVESRAEEMRGVCRSVRRPRSLPLVYSRRSILQRACASGKNGSKLVEQEAMQKLLKFPCLRRAGLHAGQGGPVEFREFLQHLPGSGTERNR